MKINLTVFKQLETIAEILPAPVYWFDSNNVLLGANHAALKAISASDLDEVVGKNAL